MSVVQTKFLGTQSRAATNAISFTSLPGAGNLVVFGLIAAANYDPSTISSVTDNQGNTYTKINSAVSNGGNAGEGELWRCESIGTPSGTFTVTAHNSVANSKACALFLLEENTYKTLDQNGVATNQAAATSGTVTASGANSNANALVVACCGVVDYTGSGWGLSSPPTTGYTAIGLDANDNGEDFEAAYKEITASETSSAHWSWTAGSSNWIALLATFKSSGGTTYNDSLTESGSASDSLSVLATFANAMTESGSAADAFATAMTMVSSIIESGAASDALATAMTMLATLSEAGAATDAVTGSTAGTTYNDTLTESGSAADALSTTATFPNSLAEAGASADSLAAGSVMSTTLAEAGAAADVVSAIATYANALAEAGSAGDAVSALATYLNAIVETGALADALTTNVHFVSLLTEAANAQDVVGFIATILTIDPRFRVYVDSRKFAVEMPERVVTAALPGRQFKVTLH